MMMRTDFRHPYHSAQSLGHGRQGKLHMVTVDGNTAEFKFFRPQARVVHLAGEFNRWRSGEVPMIKGRDGYWWARVHLPVGEFKFRYCADGEWFTDYAAFGIEMGRFGLESVVRVVDTDFAVSMRNESPAVTAA